MIWLFNRYPETFLLNACLVPVHASLGALLDLLMFVFHQAGAMRFKNGLDALVSGAGVEEDWRSRCSPEKLQEEFQEFLANVRELVFGNFRVAEADRGYRTERPKLRIHQKSAPSSPLYSPFALTV
eukprot:2059261-Rhodomonas_salina.1